jgi:dienelactone hydrolase
VCNSSRTNCKPSRIHPHHTQSYITSLSDSFARAGYLVVAPDYFRGTPNMRADPKDIDSILDTTIKYMRGELGVKKIGAAGYCFGGKYVARFLVEGKGVDAGFSAHPTNLQMAEIEAVTLPFTLAAAGEFYSVFLAVI